MVSRQRTATYKFFASHPIQADVLLSGAPLPRNTKLSVDGGRPEEGSLSNPSMTGRAVTRGTGISTAAAVMNGKSIAQAPVQLERPTTSVRA